MMARLRRVFGAARPAKGVATVTKVSPTTGQPEAEPAAPPAAELPAIPGHEILGRLGSGGMGVVYKARQVRLDRLVALKMLRADDSADPEPVVRFLSEMEST